jgi:hypothetical protein
MLLPLPVPMPLLLVAEALLVPAFDGGSAAAAAGAALAVSLQPANCTLRGVTTLWPKVNTSPSAVSTTAESSNKQQKTATG